MLVTGSTRRIGHVDLIDARDMVTLGAIAAHDIVDTIDHGRDVDGRVLPDYTSGPRQGRRVTLRRTGRLLSTIHVERVSPRVVRVRSSARYAQHVARRFSVFGVSQRAQKRIAERLYDLVAASLTASTRSVS